MSASAEFLPLPAPLVPETVTSDLVGESAYLARALGQSIVQTPGASGILNRVAPSTVWVHSEVDVDGLVAEIGRCDPAPEIMVPEGAAWLVAELARRGWKSVHVVDRLRRDLTKDDIRALEHPTSASGSIRPAGPGDLVALRRLYVQAFQAEDSADYVPDALLEVPDLALYAAVDPADASQILGTAGVRLRHRGALIFGLAVTPDHRRQGLATALTASCLVWAARQQAPYALADVDAPAPQMWPRLGFQSTARWQRCCRAD